MALIRYYNLESESSEEVSNLEKNLKKRLLDEKRIRNGISSGIENVAEAEGRGLEAFTKLIYDSGEFDVLYKDTKTISTGKRRLFRKNTPSKVGIELVVKGALEDILEIQAYLSCSKFEIIEAKTVATAILSFATMSHGHDDSRAYLESIEKMLKKDNSKLKISTNRTAINGYDSYSYGLISGDVEEVLRIRKHLIKCAPSYGTNIKHESITFL